MKKIGRQVHFISTGNNNPRNGEGSFIRLHSGRILFGFTEFIGNDWDDDADARISVIHTDDEGETWSERRVLFTKPEGAMNVMCLSFLRMNNGDVGAFYIIKNADGTDKVVFTRSNDEAQSWSEPISCMDCLSEQDYYVINNDRVVKLTSGRIFFAVARHTVKCGADMFMPGVLCFFYSDDDGRTWQKTDTEIPCPQKNNPDGYEEPGLYELPDGRLWCYIRTSLGFQYECFSLDDGITWSEPEANLFFSSPCSPMLIRNCCENVLAIFNPVPEHVLRKDSEPWGRTPYVLAVSRDFGFTFNKEDVYYLEDDLSNGYCYPAMIDVDGGFLAAYYHSNGTDVCLNCTKIIKVAAEEIAD